MKPELFIDTHGLRKAAFYYKAITSKKRLRILHLIHAHKELSVGELCKKLNLDPSIGSFHLSVLRNARKVHAHKRGKNIYYSINHERIHHIHHKSHELLQHGTK
jgi:ArsR family transcriptional regulator